MVLSTDLISKEECRKEQDNSGCRTYHVTIWIQNFLQIIMMSVVLFLVTGPIFPMSARSPVAVLVLIADTMSTIFSTFDGCIVITVKKNCIL